MHLARAAPRYGWPDATAGKPRADSRRSHSRTDLARLAAMAETEVCETCSPPTAAHASKAVSVSSESVSAPEDPLDPKTFVCPVQPGAQPCPSVVIEYCDRCRWQPRASWVQTELLLTFALPRPGEAPSKASGGVGLRSITLLPMVEDATAGRFRVWVLHTPAPSNTSVQPPPCAQADLVWDRKIESGFPELKGLVRVSPPTLAQLLTLTWPETTHPRSYRTRHESRALRQTTFWMIPIAVTAFHLH